MSLAHTTMPDGLPVFEQVGVVHKDDWAMVAHVLGRELSRLKATSRREQQP